MTKSTISKRFAFQPEAFQKTMHLRLALEKMHLNGEMRNVKVDSGMETSSCDTQLHSISLKI